MQHIRATERANFECPYCDTILDIPLRQLPTENQLTSNTDNEKRKTCGKHICKKQYQAMMHRVKYYERKRLETI